MKQEEQERRNALREGRAPQPEASGSQEGYWSYMSRQVQERTERLNVAGDSMDRLEENSSNFANDVGKYVQSQKKKAVFGCKLIDNTLSPPCLIDADRSFVQCWAQSLDSSPRGGYFTVCRFRIFVSFWAFSLY